MTEKIFSWFSGVSSVRVQWNQFSEETWKYQKRVILPVVDQKVLDCCYDICNLRAKEDIFVRKILVEVFPEMIFFPIWAGKMMLLLLLELHLKCPEG